MHPARLIVLEGIDGAGTSTQVPRLEAALRADGWRIHSTCEPSDGPVGRLLRQALRQTPPLDEATLALLFAADRLAHLETEMAAAWAAGALVLSDRYLMSSYAYQGTRLPLAWLQQLNARARRADLTLYFRVSAATAAARRQARGGPPEHFDAAARQQEILALYEAQCDAPGLGPVVPIDAEADVDSVSRQLLAAIAPCLQRWRQADAP